MSEGFHRVAAVNPYHPSSVYKSGALDYREVWSAYSATDW